MADPRRVSTRRAILSYDQYKDLYKSIGIVMPDLLVKDYQGILQDFVFTSDEIDALEIRLVYLEDRVLKTIKVTDDVIAESFHVVLC